MDKVDIVIPTRGHVNKYLLKSLKSAEWAANIYITCEKPLSIARKNAVLKASTDWVAMFDDDVVIPPHWYCEVSKHIRSDVGAIATVARQCDRDFDAYERIVNIVYKLHRIDTSPHINNVLIRRELLKSYNPPRLFLGEDQFLRRHVEACNFKWLVIGYIGVIHLGTVKNKVDVGVAYKRYAHYSFYQLLRRTFSRFILAPFAAFVNLSYKTLLRLYADTVQFASGWLKEYFHSTQIQ